MNMTVKNLVVLSLVVGLIVGFETLSFSEPDKIRKGKNISMNLTAAVKHIRPAVIQISFFAKDFSDEFRKKFGKGFLTIPLGTGFLLNTEGYAITANHVIEAGGRLIHDNSFQASEKRIEIGLALPNTESAQLSLRGNFVSVGFDVVDTDVRHDLALLKLKLNPFKGQVHSKIVISGQELPMMFSAATLSLSRPEDGEAIGVSGYPLSSPVLITNAGWLASSWSYDEMLEQIPGAPSGFSFPNVADTFTADMNV